MSIDLLATTNLWFVQNELRKFKISSNCMMFYHSTTQYKFEMAWQLKI